MYCLAAAPALASRWENIIRFCPKLVYTYNAVTYDGTSAQGGYSTHVVVDET
jgi:hypothetical protein